MNEPKTKPTDANVNDFLQNVADPKRRADALALCEFMQQVTGKQAVMWGPTMVGFGTYHYKYSSGHEGDWLAVGFSPRKAAMSVYIMDDASAYQDLLARLGTFTTGKACLYIKRLEDIDLGVLREIITRTFTKLKAE